MRLTFHPSVAADISRIMAHYEEVGGKRLAEVFRFSRKDQTMIEEAAGRLANGTDPGVVPERYLIGAARLAFDQRLASPETIKDNFYRELARR